MNHIRDFEFEGRTYSIRVSEIDVYYAVGVFDEKTGECEWEQRISPKWWKALPHEYWIDDSEKAFRTSFVERRKYLEELKERANRGVIADED